jgi:hypothetical protein
MEQVAALSDEALDGYAEVLNALELAPWSGWPQHAGNPHGAVRRWFFRPWSGWPGDLSDRGGTREVHLLVV